MHDTANILGFSFFSKRKAQLLTELKKFFDEKKSVRIIFTPNAEQLVLAQQNPNFNRYLKQADLLLADGMSVVWASRVLTFFKKCSQPIAQRISGIDLAKELIEIGRQRQLKILLIGGRDYQQSAGVSPQTVSGQKNLWQLADSLFWTPGFRNVNKPQDQEQSALKSHLLKIKPDMVFVAFGAPHQEEWLINNRDLLNQVGAKLAVSVGGAFDVIFGRLKRAPAWMQKLGLEWLFRLIQEPWRWKRQLSLVEFVGLVIKQL
jgi:N-acetylglucosaminyldiphosphoundecaprenol N-acetyl-beta-D-mannosaminyltransferase